TDHEGVGAPGNQLFKGVVEFALAADFQFKRLQSVVPTSALKFPQFVPAVRVGGVHEVRNRFKLWQERAEQLQLLSDQGALLSTYAGQVSARTIESGDKAQDDRIATDYKYNWNSRSSGPGGDCGRVSVGGDDGRATTDKIGKQLTHPVAL